MSKAGRYSYRHLYRTKQWMMLATRQLQEHPLCAFCASEGIVKAATVADHVVPHKGDPALFYQGRLQSLCKHHHDSSKQQIERKGFTNHVGADGWPVDPNHPANRIKIWPS